MTWMAALNLPRCRITLSALALLALLPCGSVAIAQIPAPKSPTVVRTPAPFLGLKTRRLLKLTLEQQGRALAVLSRYIRWQRKARALRRYRGRWRAILYSGRTRLETVSFSFPLGLRAGEPAARHRELDQKIQAGARSRVALTLPYPPNLTHIDFLAPGALTGIRYRLGKKTKADSQRDSAPRQINLAPRSAAGPRG